MVTSEMATMCSLARLCFAVLLALVALCSALPPTTMDAVEVGDNAAKEMEMISMQTAHFNNDLGESVAPAVGDKFHLMDHYKAPPIMTGQQIAESIKTDLEVLDTAYDGCQESRNNGCSQIRRSDSKAL